MDWLLRLFFPWRRRADFAPSMPPEEIDPRTRVIPVAHEHAGKTYFETAQMWAKERLRIRRVLLDIADGKRPITDAETLPADFQCELGTWLRFVQPEGREAQAILDDLRLWHTHWHSATNQIIVHLAAGHFAYARQSLSSRAGPWSYAARKVDRLLEALWVHRPPQHDRVAEQHA
jgi:hypothetical protein